MVEAAAAVDLEEVRVGRDVGAEVGTVVRVRVSAEAVEVMLVVMGTEEAAESEIKEVAEIVEVTSLDVVVVL